jgi:Ca-activated chloride channel family protein
MKAIALAAAMVLSLASNSFAKESQTLRLKLEPERDYLLSGARQEIVVKIDLSAVETKRKGKRVPLNLSVVLDRSGSMTGAKIEKTKQAAMELVDRLAPEDTLSVISFSDHANIIFSAQPVEDKEALKARISQIRTGGSTALYEGVHLGAEQVRKHLSGKRINRVMLLSDGLANIGPSSPAQLRQLGRSLSEVGIAVTTIGVGDDYNEELMSGLAESSDANYYYVQDSEKLPEIFAKELGELRTVAARQVQIEIICPEGVRPLGFIGRPERFDGQKAAVQLNQVTAGQDRFIFLRCLVDDGRAEIARVKVSYLDELNGGVEQALSEAAQIRYTRDRNIAAKSERASVMTQKQLLLTAVAKDEAILDADAGHYQKAAQKLAAQAAVLDQQYQNAPAPMQSQLREESKNLRARASEIQQNDYQASTRKALQCESWNYRNSKSAQ